MQTDASHPFGCLVVLATATCAPENRHIQARLAIERQGNRDGLRACVERAVAAGELRPDTDTQALTTLFDGLLVGLATQARDGVPLAALEAGISAAMEVWDAHAVSRRGRRSAGVVTKGADLADDRVPGAAPQHHGQDDGIRRDRRRSSTKANGASSVA